MGIHDRPYYADEQDQNWTGGPLWSQRMVVTNLVLINLAFFILNLLFGGRDNALTLAMKLQGSDLVQPWNWWHLISYAFAHSPENAWHIAGNMFGLWMLGRSVEIQYGRNEFLRIYLLAALLGGLVFMVRSYLSGDPSPTIGASGAVICIEMLFVLLNPRATLMFYGVFPIPAWVLGVFLILGNFFGNTDYIAYDVHLAGIAFAFVYFYGRLNFGRMFEGINLRAWKRRLTGPKLKLHDPAAEAKETKEAEEADRILQKIYEQGQDSLTAKERRFMEKYSLKKRKERENNS
jgi:membrane associated rhomboid family serine protease